MSLADINHVVLFMQENRAFDHYFGTMAGVRGFADPQAFVNPSTNRSVFYQDVNAKLSNATDHLLPWYLNYEGGTYPKATQCMTAGSNSWQANHNALNAGLNNKWAEDNTPYSWGYYKRSDLPVHFALAEAWTVGDMYQESVIASTSPNRATWASGSINCPGGPQTPDQGGIYIDNNASPGCEGTNLNCYPLKWETFPEYLQEAGVSWQVYQDQDNFGDNPLAWFEQFENAKKGSPLEAKGMQYVGLQRFYDDAKNSKLPAVSYIIGPAELSEHPPYQPKDGAWLQKKITDALVNSPSYKNSALIISYDETGGWGDHVIPFHSPEGTPGEWIKDPYGSSNVYTGPGFRLPFYIISPWTRGGNVYVENVDHTSQIKFLESWLAAKGTPVNTTQIPAWRRANMADLTTAFDFNSPDFSIPSVPAADTPTTDSKGNYNGYSQCEATYSKTKPDVPYGKQDEKSALFVENGFKEVRGQLTEGRYLVFEQSGYALADVSGSTTKATAKHDSKDQRLIAHQVDRTARAFQLQAAGSGKWFSAEGAFDASTQASADKITITDLGNGAGYSIVASSGRAYSISSSGKLSGSRGNGEAGFRLFSVTYSS